MEKTQKLIADREELQAGWTEIFRDREGEATRDRLKSGELLAKSQGLFIDRLEIKGVIANLSTSELVQLIENKAKLLGVSVNLDTDTLAALPDPTGDIEMSQT